MQAKNHVKYFCNGCRVITVYADKHSADELSLYRPSSDASSDQRSFARNADTYLTPLRNAMGRSFAACLGCIAMLTQIASGFLHGTDTETTLVRCVVALVIAAIPGWIIGQMADAVVRESIEAQYRRQIEQFKSQPTGKTGTA